jgi:hypothetical protein
MNGIPFAYAIRRKSLCRKGLRQIRGRAPLVGGLAHPKHKHSTKSTRRYPPFGAVIYPIG